MLKTICPFLSLYSLYIISASVLKPAFSAAFCAVRAVNAVTVTFIPAALQRGNLKKNKSKSRKMF